MSPGPGRFDRYSVAGKLRDWGYGIMQAAQGLSPIHGVAMLERSSRDSVCQRIGCNGGLRPNCGCSRPCYAGPMLAATMLLFASAHPSVCVDYTAARREAAFGKRDEEARRYAAADRHYVLGLKLIRHLHGESLSPARTIDDTGIIESMAYGYRLHGQMKQAASASGATLRGRLEIVEEGGRCR